MENLTFGIVIAIVVPVATAAFTFGMLKGKFDSMVNKVEQTCNAVTRLHERIDGHLEWHCANTSSQPSNNLSRVSSKSQFLKMPDDDIKKRNI